jgi:alginate O-acetyltransferase complex protein AlgI
MLLCVSIFFNIGVLVYFKYFNFFIDSFHTIFSIPHGDYSTINIILPVGISFYSLQTLGYVIDVYRNETKPTKDIVNFIAFVSFFPQLVAGPIERAKHLLPQFESRRTFNDVIATEGLRQILWGLFKKVVIADNCGLFVSEIYNNYDSASGLSLLVATFLFSIQIYCDFSGYSEIASGTAKLFGFSLMRNFNYPYFSRRISDFWRRWHISLTTWLKDYIYIPLGGSRISFAVTIQNTLLVFLLSGLWHGARVTFLAWGLINALFFIVEIFYKKYIRRSKRINAINGISAVIIFTLISFTWIFFRSETMPQALTIIQNIFSSSTITSFPQQAIAPCILTVTLLAIEYSGRNHEFAFVAIHQSRRWIRWSYYILIIFIIGFLSVPNQQFIYFQF